MNDQPLCDRCGEGLRFERLDGRYLWSSAVWGERCPNHLGATHKPSHDHLLETITLLFAAYAISDGPEQDEWQGLGEALISVSPDVTPLDLQLCRIEALARIAMCGEYDVHFDA